MAVVSVTASTPVEMVNVVFKHNAFYCSTGQYSHDAVDMVRHVAMERRPDEDSLAIAPELQRQVNHVRSPICLKH